MIALQVAHLAKEAPPLVEALPRALRSAVRYNKVPNELREDVLWLASKIEPQVDKINAQIKQLPEQAHNIAEKIEPAAERASEVLIPCQ